METKSEEDPRKKTEHTEEHQDRAEADADARTGTKRRSERRQGEMMDREKKSAPEQQPPATTESLEGGAKKDIPHPHRQTGARHSRWGGRTRGPRRRPLDDGPRILATGEGGTSRKQKAGERALEIGKWHCLWSEPTLAPYPYLQPCHLFILRPKQGPAKEPRTKEGQKEPGRERERM